MVSVGWLAGWVVASDDYFRDAAFLESRLLM